MVIDRRTAVQGLLMSVLPVAAPTLGFSQTLPDGGHAGWAAWKDRFLTPEGRVVDQQNDDISHSEGQGYGALLAQANGDRAAFDRIENWTRANLLVRQDRLMAWRWRPSSGVVDADWYTATDGDLFRAWALLRAARDSGWTGAGSNVRDIARDIAALCLRPDPRAANAPLLTPGAEALSTPERVLINPSYLMPRALRELGAAADLPDLIAAADHGEQVLSELAALGSVPDWIDVTLDGYEVAPVYGHRSGYDALRIPLFLIWSDNPDHPAVARAADTFALADAADHVAVVTSWQSGLEAQSNQTGFRAIADMAHCRTDTIAPDQDILQDYYPATLEQLVTVAKRESTGCRQ